ncbi:hypothetical protein VE04_06659 [Pseudogymnoascus sp. 24MN13]|nr:hypothetical protein VE04_06659 [Pseudogymnoascus sp. 24MN13]
MLGQYRISKCYISLLTTRNSSSLPVSSTLHPSCKWTRVNLLYHENTAPRLILDAIDVLYSAVVDEHISANLVASVSTTEPKIGCLASDPGRHRSFSVPPSYEDSWPSEHQSTYSYHDNSSPRLILDAIDVPASPWMLDQGAPA